jgi:hypothetical protein
MKAESIIECIRDVAGEYAERYNDAEGHDHTREIWSEICDAFRTLADRIAAKAKEEEPAAAATREGGGA